MTDEVSAKIAQMQKTQGFVERFLSMRIELVCVRCGARFTNISLEAVRHPQVCEAREP